VLLWAVPSRPSLPVNLSVHLDAVRDRILRDILIDSSNSSLGMSYSEMQHIDPEVGTGSERKDSLLTVGRG